MKETAHDTPNGGGGPSRVGPSLQGPTSPIKIYGSSKSSAGRCYWMMEECQLKYQRVPLDFSVKEHKSDAYLKLNPNGKVPTIVDGDLVLWESLSICRYLASKYKPELLGTDEKQAARIDQWSTWAMTELQPPWVEVLVQHLFVPPERKNHKLIEDSITKGFKNFQILENHLLALGGPPEKSFLVGKVFSLADLMVASVVRIAPDTNTDYAGKFPQLAQWLKTQLARPAVGRVP